MVKNHWEVLRTDAERSFPHGFCTILHAHCWSAHLDLEVVAFAYNTDVSPSAEIMENSCLALEGWGTQREKLTLHGRIDWSFSHREFR